MLKSADSVNATVFGFNMGTVFTIDGFAKRALAVSAIASALGLAIDAVLLFMYFGADARKFQACTPLLHCTRDMR